MKKIEKLKKKGLRPIIQGLFFLLFNADLLIFIRLIRQRTALVSQSFLKRFCIPGLHCYSCPSAVSSCPIGALQFWLNDLTLKIQLKEKINLAGFYIIGFLSLSGLIGGRIYCGWVCPFGFIQDIMGRISRKNKMIPPIMTGLKYACLLILVILLPILIYDLTLASPWFCKLVCPAGTLTAGIPLLLADPLLRQSIGSLFYLKISILLLFLSLFLVTQRAFCKILCPLGAFWGLFNRVSLFQLQINRNTCIQCGKCQQICPMHIKVLKKINSQECIRCLKCQFHCPTNSIHFRNIFYKEKK